MKKALSCLLALCLILSCFSMNAAAFEDVKPSAWYYEAMTFMQDRGIVQGYPDGTMKPEGKMTRANFVVALSRGAQDLKPPASEQIFTDVLPTAYYYEMVQWAYANGIVSGVNATEFRPHQSITREQAVKMLYAYVSALGRDLEAAPSGKMFTDRDSVSSWATEAMDWAVDTGIVNGDSQNRLLPQKEMSRAELCMMLYNAWDIITGTAAD